MERAQRKALRRAAASKPVTTTVKPGKGWEDLLPPLPQGLLENSPLVMREVQSTQVLEFTQDNSVSVPREHYKLVRAADLERIRRRIAKLRKASSRWHAAAWGTGGIGSGIACAALTVSDGALVSSPLLWTVAGACGVLTACFTAMERETAGEEREAVAELLHEVDEAIANSEGQLR